MLCENILDFNFSKLDHPVVKSGGLFGKSFTISPRVYKVGGGYLMFCSESGNFHGVEEGWTIVTRKSRDGLSWKKSDGALFENMPFGKSAVTAPDLVLMPDGRWRLFYESREGDAYSAVIASATSGDLVDWEFEKVWVRDEEYGAGTPSVLIDEGKIRIYHHWLNKSEYFIKCSEFSLEGEFLRSFDCLKQENSLEEFAVYAPHVLKLDDKYLMCYSAWAKEPRDQGRIFFAFSEDGISWEKKKESIIESSNKYDERHCSEPFLFFEEDKATLYYEACNFKKEWVIMAASTSI